jgi:probable F420-dependent oxidoreductase
MRMPGTRPFRFSGGLYSATSATEWLEGARRLESDGYDVLVTGDHFTPRFAPMPALTAAALATTTLRVGCTVFNNDWRHPLALAKEVSTADVLSGGRFEFGIGAGWSKPEYDSLGIAFDPPAVRVSRFEEAVRVIKSAWGDGSFTFHGQHYLITEYDGQPKPLQRPHPPILIGGGGSRLLSVAAREADIIGILPRATTEGTLDSGDETDASVAQKVEVIRRAAGDRFDQVELNLYMWEVAVTDDRRAAAEAIATRRSRPVDYVLESPYFLIGTINAMVEKVLELRERHLISYISVFPSDTKAFAPVVARLSGK